MMKKESKNLLLTFDFELFLGGRSGTVDNCLIIPTTELIKVVKKYNLSVVFFVDTLYLDRLKEVAKTNKDALLDYEKIISLLRDVLKQGGYVFHHIHPHWLDAVYLEEINQWDLTNKRKFAINNLSKEEIALVFEKSNAIIHEIYREYTLPKYFGYRAGGLYAQPFSNYREQMKKFNIRFDFSVLKNAKSVGENHFYEFNYETFPKETIYSFSNEVNQKDAEGTFIEIAMDQFELKGINKIVNGIHYRRNFKKENWKRWGDGKSSGNVVKNKQVSNKFVSEETFSIELLNKVKSKLYAKHFKNNHLLHIISHPKLFSPVHIESFVHFIDLILLNYEIETDLYRIVATSLPDEV